jgi:phosphotransacetylase
MDGDDPILAFDALRQRNAAPLKTAIVHPVDIASIGAALQAAKQGLIVPVLIGPKARIEQAAQDAEATLSGIEVIDAPHSHAAAEASVDLAVSGKIDALMKGALHTNEIMTPALSASPNLRTERRMSHAFVMRTNAYPKWLIVSDGALNISPDLSAKRWIVQNAIDLARAIGIKAPRAAILSATEEVDPKVPSTIDAAALCKMADRGQIRGGQLDGPLAFDLAVSMDAVRAKNIVSDVAGEADILIVPNLESGNMLAKQLDYLAGAEAAGLILGAKVPIVLNSRSDSVDERVASCIVAHRYHTWLAEMKT